MQRYVVSDVRMASSSRDIGTVEDRESLLKVPSWDYRDNAQRFSACYNARRFLE